MYDIQRFLASRACDDDPYHDIKLDGYQIVANIPIYIFGTECNRRTAESRQKL